MRLSPAQRAVVKHVLMAALATPPEELNKRQMRSLRIAYDKVSGTHVPQVTNRRARPRPTQPPVLHQSRQYEFTEEDAAEMLIEAVSPHP